MRYAHKIPSVGGQIDREVKVMDTYEDLAESKLELSSRVQFTVVEGEVVILDFNRGVYLGLDEVGTRVWQFLAEKPRMETIIEKLHEEYRAPAETIRRDVLRFVQDLLVRGVVEIRSDN